VLAVPAAVWAGAFLDPMFADCDYDCGERGRGWFVYVLLTAPLIPIGAWLAVPGIRPGRLYLIVAAFCFAIALLVYDIRRRLPPT
jgi:hypothetical protein